MRTPNTLLSRMLNMYTCVMYTVHDAFEDLLPFENQYFDYVERKQ